MQGQVAELQQRLDDKTGCGEMLGISRPMRELFALVARVPAPIDILICGETGTGKELIRADPSPQPPRRWTICGSQYGGNRRIDRRERTLWSRSRRFCTSADRDRQGVFEQAHGGTLFLDEIGDMPLSAQAKILRALQQRVIQPVGSPRSVQVDVRVITPRIRI